jgi:dipeptidyl aminopeptidase/acylaminoacyl peptidase
MYFDADLHLDKNRLLLAYQAKTETQCLLLKDLSGSTIMRIDSPYAEGPRWSPDGRWFAYFGDGRLYIHEAIEIKPAHIIEMPGYHAGFCEWSPSGKSLVFSAYSAGTLQPPDIYRYDFESASISRLTESLDVDRFPKWSHGGTRIACQRTYIGTSENQTGIVVIDLAGNREIALPRPEDFSQRISRNCWSPDDKHLIFTEYRDGESRFVVYDLATEAVVWSSKALNISGCGFDPYTGHVFSVTHDALSICELPARTLYAQISLPDTVQIKETLSGPVVFFAPHEEEVYFLGNDSRIYRWQMNQACIAIFEPEPEQPEMAYQRNNYVFRASDGLGIPVQHYMPENPNGRAVVFVEGGPGGIIDPHNAISARLLVEGYEVIRPAYRGCAGYGDDHLKANRAQCGQADVRDVVECGLDWRQRFNKPDAPLAVAGYSYGGYLTFLALTYSDAPWTCGISFWGCTRIPPLVQTTGLPADPLAHQTALEERSAVQQSHRIQFPLLVLHGERDTTALTQEVKLIRDRVSASGFRCDLVVFGNEGHGLKGCRPEMYARTLSFLDEHMK